MNTGIHNDTKNYYRRLFDLSNTGLGPLDISDPREKYILYISCNARDSWGG